MTAGERIKQVVLVSCLLICCSGSFGSQNLRAYYDLIYKAEIDILNVNYKSASTNYKNAFQNIGTPFALDIYNNMLVSIQLRDNGTLSKLAKLLLAKGVDTSYFRKSIFSEFRMSNEWKSVVSAFPEIKKQCAKRIKKDVVNKLKSIAAADVEFASIHDGNRFDSAVNNEFNKREDSLCNVLVDLMEQNDYLSEEKVGVQCNDTDIQFSPICDVVYIHSFQLHDSSILTRHLFSAINKGKIKSAQAMRYLSYGRAFNYLNDFYVYRDTLFRRNAEDLDTDNLNLLSKDPTPAEKRLIEFCYMDTPAHLIEKVKFHFQLVCNARKGKELNGFKYFIFGPSITGIVGDKKKPKVLESAQVIDICRGVQ